MPASEVHANLALGYTHQCLRQVHPCGRFRHNSIVNLLGHEHGLWDLHSASGRRATPQAAAHGRCRRRPLPMAAATCPNPRHRLVRLGSPPSPTSFPLMCHIVVCSLPPAGPTHVRSSHPRQVSTLLLLRTCCHPKDTSPRVGHSPLLATYTSQGY